MKRPVFLSLSSCVLFGIAAPVLGQHQHEGDVIIGRSSSSRLLFEADLNEIRPLEAVNGLLKGWAGDEPGFEALMEDVPDEGLYKLAPGAQIWLEAISLDPALKAHDPLNPLLLMDSPGDQLFLGNHELHDHVIWHVDSLDAGFNPLQTVWYGTFKLVDKGTTAYSDSDPFTLGFTNAPEPGTLGLLFLGSWAAFRRRGGVRRAVCA